LGEAILTEDEGFEMKLWTYCASLYDVCTAGDGVDDNIQQDATIKLCDTWTGLLISERETGM
jgi:hypothetical protein